MANIIRRYALDCGHRILTSGFMNRGDEWRCQVCASKHKKVRRVVVRKVENAKIQ